MMYEIKNRKSLSLLFTDSGLGGLSICADMVKHLTDQKKLDHLSVVYFNAWPSTNRGYNFLREDKERVRIFGNALEAMNRYNPDMIFIACNTLSVLYRQGDLVTKCQVPVVDIIDFGVDNIYEKLSKHEKSKVLILGTRTTVSSGVHKKRLLERGIESDRIIQQDCHGLAGAIEEDPESPRVNSLVESFMAEAAANLKADTQHIIAALCCTHYGYIQKLIKNSLSHLSCAKVDIINPNKNMSECVEIKSSSKHVLSTNLDVKVVSRVELPSLKIETISAKVNDVCPQVALSLQNYQQLPNLFRV